MDEYIVVDRIENEKVVLQKEDKTEFFILKDNLPFDIKEGDVLKKTACGYEFSSEETENCRARIQKKMSKLFVKKSK